MSLLHRVSQESGKGPSLGSALSPAGRVEEFVMLDAESERAWLRKQCCCHCDVVTGSLSFS